MRCFNYWLRTGVEIWWNSEENKREDSVVKPQLGGFAWNYE